MEGRIRETAGPDQEKSAKRAGATESPQERRGQRGSGGHRGDGRAGYTPSWTVSRRRYAPDGQEGAAVVARHAGGAQAPALDSSHISEGGTSFEAEPLDKSQGWLQGASDEQKAEAFAEGRKRIKKRRRQRAIGLSVVRKLVSFDEPKGGGDRMDYGRSFGCCSTIRQEDGQLTSWYCGKRWCIVCNRIRMARLIDLYQPVLEGWDDPQHVVLTVPNCRREELEETVQRMIDQVALCRRQIRGTRGLQYKALRSLECTFKASDGSFHPHFHLFVEGREVAQALRVEWLKRWPEARWKAQFVGEWGTSKAAMKEVVKYATKMIGAKEGEQAPPGWAMDTIFRVLKGKKLIQPLGFDKPEAVERKTEEVEEMEGLEAAVAAFERPGEKVLWEWDRDESDWLDKKTGAYLIGEDLPDDVQRLVASMETDDSRAPPVRPPPVRCEADHVPDKEAHRAAVSEAIAARLGTYAQVEGLGPRKLLAGTYYTVFVSSNDPEGFTVVPWSRIVGDFPLIR